MAVTATAEALIYPLVAHGKNRVTRIVPADGHPWPVHIYSPAFRRNPTAPKDDQVPLWVTHDPAHDYRRVILVEGVDFANASGRTDVERPLPTGKGGGVVAAVWCSGPFHVWTTDPWNWGLGGLPPWVYIPEEYTREDLYRAVIGLYTKGGK